MLFYLIAKNTDRVIFGEMIQKVRYPDHYWDMDQYDTENVELMEARHEKIGRKMGKKVRKGASDITELKERSPGAKWMRSLSS